MKHTKPYIVRGFDVTAAPFTSLGEMTSQANFVEKVVDKQHEAVAALLTDTLGYMSSSRVRSDSVPGFHATVTDLGAQTEITVVDIKIVTLADDSNQLRQFRSEIREILKHWAEKSRVPGVRGWRANALKTPTFEYDPQLDTVVIKTQAVLSTAVFYNQNRVTVGAPVDFQQAVSDLTNLKQHVEMALGGYYKTMYYSHSQFGKGEVL